MTGDEEDIAPSSSRCSPADVRHVSTPSRRRHGQRYKTELCRQFEENGSCCYGSRCQFAHGRAELRSVARHPKYKTDLCRTFHTTGLCPYGSRCHFIHNDDDRRKPGDAAVCLEPLRAPLTNDGMELGEVEQQILGFILLVLDPSVPRWLPRPQPSGFDVHSLITTSSVRQLADDLSMSCGGRASNCSQSTWRSSSPIDVFPWTLVE